MELVPAAPYSPAARGSSSALAKDGTAHARAAFPAVAHRLAAHYRYSPRALVDPEASLQPARPGAVTRLRRVASALVGQLAALLIPDRGVPPLVAAVRFRLAMAIVIGAAILAAAVVGARLDVAPEIRAESAGAPPPAGGAAPAPAGAAAPEVAEVKTDREIEEEVTKRTAVLRVKLGFAAALGVPARILMIALALYLLGRYVGGKPTLARTVTAASVGALPWAVRSMITAAAAWRQGAVRPAELDGLVASHLALTLDHPLLARLAGGADLFTVWSVVLCGLGLATAAGIGRARGVVTVTIAFTLYLLITTTGSR